MPTEIEQLYREHRAGLVRLVERELRDRHDAEDVVQTAFLDAQRALEGGTIPRNPRAWLATIALNAARRLRRRRLNAQPLEDYAVQEASEVTEIRAALETLPRAQRAAVLYRDVLGLSYGETAEQMGRSIDAVTMLLHRGRRRLRETLGAVLGPVGLGRWFREAGTQQVAIAKGAAAVVLSAGLATGGVVAAGHAAGAVAPIKVDTMAAPAAHSGLVAAQAGNTPHGTLAPGTAPGHVRPLDDSKTSAVLGSTQAGDAPATGAAATPGAAPPSTDAAVAQSRSRSVLSLPTVALPTLTTPTLPATVAATATVATPVTTATVAVTVGTTVAVTTPITTVTLPIP